MQWKEFFGNLCAEKVVCEAQVVRDRQAPIKSLIDLSKKYDFHFDFFLFSYLTIELTAELNSKIASFHERFLWILFEYRNFSQ